MNLTEISALVGGIACMTAGMLVLALGLMSRKPKHALKRRKEEEDFWPTYQPAQRKNTK